MNPPAPHRRRDLALGLDEPARVGEPLQALPPERPRAVERRSAQEERRRHSASRQRGRRQLDVGGKVVVECDGDRKPSAAGTLRSRPLDLFRSDRTVEPSQVPELSVEPRLA